MNSQVKSGQSWTMTIQNAGEGYFGYLDSPAGQNLPYPDGSTPGGAQFQLMTQTEINAQPPWAVQLEAELGVLIGLTILAVATGGTGDAALLAADVAEDVAADAAEDAADATAEAEVGGGVAEDGEAVVVQENIITDSFMNEVYGAGEGALSFGDSFSAIAAEELDGSLISVDGLGEDVEVWADGEWTDLEGEVEVDVDAFEEPMIWEVDEVSFQDEIRELKVDAEAEAEKATQRAVQKVWNQAWDSII
jgi:hypothetical protein